MFGVTLVLSKPVQTYIPFADSVLQALAPLTNLKALRAHQSRSSGQSIGQFPLTHLDLNYVVAFNDDGMKNLKDMTTLSQLYLRGTLVTDAGLENLAGLTNLTELDLSDILGMTDAGMEWVAQLPKLQFLNLNYTTVSDAGLAMLSEHSDFLELMLDRANVPDESVDPFNQRHAHVRISPFLDCALPVLGSIHSSRSGVGRLGRPPGMATFQ